MSKVRLKITDWQLAVCKLTEASFPEWAKQSEFLSFTKTTDENSLVCEAAYVPKEVQAETGWSCIKVEGTLDFGMVGVIAGITQVLAEKQISVFVISTFDTDYLLVKNTKLEATKDALETAGYVFVN